MEFRDYYEVMGVSRDATQDEIKKAYRRLARKYHPDVSKAADAEERFKEVGEAYAVLKDPEKRAAYDQLGKDWKAGQDFRPPPDWDAGFEFSEGGFGGDSAGFSDFFDSLFGQGGFQAGGRPRGEFRVRGEDHHAKVLIDLEDAYRGASRSISLKAPELTPEGQLVTRQRTLNVRIPRGVRQGQRIRLAGQGSPGIGGAPAGDLYLEIEFNPHRRYRVEGRDVFMRLPIAPWEAALGSSVTVATPDGDVDMKVPAGTTSSRKLRLKGRGIPGTPPGDLYVELDITLPPADSEKAKKLYENMRDELAYNPRERMGA